MRNGLFVSLGLFAATCCTPALETEKSSVRELMFGGHALLMGWLGIFAGVLGWFANPFWLLGLICGFFGKRIPAGLAGLVSVAIGLTAFSIVGRELPGDEGNVTKMTVLRLLPGCYLWLASLVTLTVSAFLPGPPAAPPRVR